MKNQRKLEKVSLSEVLENRIFERRLKKTEMLALKERCTQYQAEAPPEWAPNLFLPYAQYFGTLSALKVRSVLEELEKWDYLNFKPEKFIDFGAGTLGASLGATDFFRERKIHDFRIHAYDLQLSPMKWAREEFKAHLPHEVHLALGSLKETHWENTLLVAVDVLNEMQMFKTDDSLDETSPAFKEILAWSRSLSPTSLMIFIEPASKTFNQRLLRLRDRLIQEAPVLLPCTHQFSCPALAQKEWCHEERDYKAHPHYWNLVRDMGFQRHFLQFSLLVLGAQKSKFKPEDARMVSRPLKSKGRCDKWLCSNGRRWKQSLLSRHQNERNTPYFEAARGDVIHLDQVLSSTELQRPE